MGSPIAKLLLKPELRHVAKFQKCRLKNVEKSASRKKIEKKTSANIMVFAITSAMVGGRKKYILACHARGDYLFHTVSSAHILVPILW